MFQIAVCDDEQKIAEDLGYIVKKFFRNKIMDVCVELFLDGNKTDGIFNYYYVF